ncbi:MAG: phytanoyl-CoA dioxygenase family protein [Planctomycetes bacterium]|nr:phytanoyl-CoA dioxygenase family protein [Planctomycetota bacterium]
MQLPPDFAQTIRDRGCSVVESVLSVGEVSSLRESVEAAVEAQPEDESVRDRGGVYAIRNLTEVVPAVRELHSHPNVARLVAEVLGPQAVLVRGLFFDKTPDSNWGIFWHQDLSIAVRRREQVDGFRPWSVKAGIPHVQPPPQILDGMLTVRLHLDDCLEANGALRVIPGSHRSARLNLAEAEQLQQNGEPMTCEVSSAGAVVMKPLLLHSSHKATSDSRRRVLHLEFASGPLPEPLEWYHSDPIAAGLVP